MADAAPLTYSDLIGKPFKYGARGPDEYDCWGLVSECYRRVHGIQIPDLASPEEDAVQHALGVTMRMQPFWERGLRKPGTIVAIRLGRFVCHTGFYLGDDRMIHTWKSTGGVVVQALQPWLHRIEGYYRYVP